jgi:hypothetical protein
LLNKLRKIALIIVVSKQGSDSLAFSVIHPNFERPGEV